MFFCHQRQLLQVQPSTQLPDGSPLLNFPARARNGRSPQQVRAYSTCCDSPPRGLPRQVCAQLVKRRLAAVPGIMRHAGTSTLMLSYIINAMTAACGLAVPPHPCGKSLAESSRGQPGVMTGGYSRAPRSTLSQVRRHTRPLSRLIMIQQNAEMFADVSQIRGFRHAAEPARRRRCAGAATARGGCAHGPRRATRHCRRP